MGKDHLQTHCEFACYMNRNGVLKQSISVDNRTQLTASTGLILAWQLPVLQNYLNVGDF